MLIIGSRGFLGSYIARDAKSGFDLIEGNRTLTGVPGEVHIDIKNAALVNAAFEKARPDIVLLCSAIADIDYCQQHPDEARAINLQGAQFVAEACARTNARLIFTSTGAVFDGLKHGYTEDDPISPVSVYGETKAQAEKVISEICPSSITVRLSLVLGFSAREGTNALLDNLKKKLASGQAVPLPIFEHRNPIDAGTCSQFMLDLLKKPATCGIFHIGCTEAIPRYDLGLALAARMGFSGKVQPQYEPTPGRAPRGLDHYLLTGKLRAASTIPIPTIEEVIARSFDVPA
jgi:dTDP-4-dehydrorhamnose reductase